MGIHPLELNLWDHTQWCRAAVQCASFSAEIIKGVLFSWTELMRPRVTYRVVGQQLYKMVSHIVIYEVWCIAQASTIHLNIVSIATLHYGVAQDTAFNIRQSLICPAINHGQQAFIILQNILLQTKTGRYSQLD